MDYHAYPSETTLPTTHDITYPPQSQYMSRSTSQHSSGSSFVKKHGLMSDDSIQEPVPPLKATVGKPSAPEPQNQWMKLFPKSWPIRLFLATVILETIVDLAIQGDIYARISASTSEEERARDNIRKVVIYLALFSFAHVFQLVISIEAVWQQNTLQFLSVTVFNFLFFVYSLVEATEIRNLGVTLDSGITKISVHTLTVIAQVVIGVSEFAFIALGWQIYKEFGWKVYKFLGADLQIKRIFAQYQIYLSLIRFDFFFCIGFTGQLVAFAIGKDDAEFYLTIVALPLGVLVLAGGHFAARYENKWLMFSFMTGCVCATVYFAYKLFKIHDGNHVEYQMAAKSLTTFAALSLLFLVFTFIWGCVVMHNFGRGLKEQMSKKQTSGHVRRGTSVTLDKHFPMSTNRNRMSIE